MTLQAVPVTIEDGLVRSMDGSSLPQHAYAVLVILPNPISERSTEEWQQPFDDFFSFVRGQSINDLDKVSDLELNSLIHHARQSS